MWSYDPAARPAAGLSVDDLSPQLVERIVARARAWEPTAIAVLAHGSYATGTARPDSDLDLDIVISGEATVHYRTWFEDRGESLPLHVSARMDMTLEAWAREADEDEPWALGMPVEAVHAWMWVHDAAVKAALGDPPVIRKPGSPPEIEDMVETALKVRRAARDGDALGVRLWAHELPGYASPVIVGLNTVSPVGDPRAALDAVLSLPVVPDGWRDDLMTCLGMHAPDDAAIAAAVRRLTLGVLRMARELRPDIDPQPDVAIYVADGTFERMLLEG